jgi:hypothetical protein
LPRDGPGDIQSPGAVVIENRILLPRFALKRRASFKLLVLLSGTGGGVHGTGHIRRGQIVRETRGRGRLTLDGSIAFARQIGQAAGPSQDLLRAASYNPVTVTCAGCSTVNR